MVGWLIFGGFGGWLQAAAPVKLPPQLIIDA
jgi:hypothetical protein